MSNRTFHLIIVALAASGCGGSTVTDGSGGSGGASGASSSAEYQICDGTTALRLGYQLSGGGQMPSGEQLLAQNGFSYLFVDGTCHYWVFGNSFAAQSDYWQATHTGTLSAGEADALGVDLEISHWPAAANGPGCADGSAAAFWTTDAVFRGMPCAGGPVAGLNQRAHAWVEQLWSEGAAVDGPVRLVAITVSPDIDDQDAATATLGFDLAPLAVSWNAGSAGNLAGSAALLADPARTHELRGARDAVVAGQFPAVSTVGRALPVRQNGVLYAVVFRDAVPLEDPAGGVGPTD